MIRPIETSLSLYSVEHQASQTKDPNASHSQVVVQTETKQDSEHASNSVRKMDRSEAGLKVREEEKRRREREKEKKREKSEDREKEQRQERHPGGGFSFVA